MPSQVLGGKTGTLVINKHLLKVREELEKMRKDELAGKINNYAK